MLLVLITCISDGIPILCVNLPAGKNNSKFQKPVFFIPVHFSIEFTYNTWWTFWFVRSLYCKDYYESGIVYGNDLLFPYLQDKMEVLFN